MNIKLVGVFGLEMASMAVRLAHDGHCVWVSAHADITHYPYAKTLIALWDYYTHTKNNTQGRIIFHKIDFDVIWLFLMPDYDVDDDFVFNIILKDGLKDKYDLPALIISGQASLGVMDTIASHWQGLSFYCPLLFLKDGDDLASLLTPNFVMIGEKISGSFKRVACLCELAKSAKSYRCDSIAVVDLARAALLGMLATRLSFINEMAGISEHLSDNSVGYRQQAGRGTDFARALDLICLDGRIGREYLSAAAGFGGVSLPFVLDDLARHFARHQKACPLISAAKRVNDEQKEWLFSRYWQHYGGDIEGRKVLLWGAGYRRGTGNLTGSSIFLVARLLLAYQNLVLIYSPLSAPLLYDLMDDEKNIISQSVILDSIDNIKMDNIDAVLIINDENLNIDDLVALNAPVFDGKNALDERDIIRLNDYYGVGRVWQKLH